MDNKKIKEPKVLSGTVTDTEKTGFKTCGEKDVGALHRNLASSKNGNF